MPTNDRIILEQFIEQRRAEIAPELHEGTFFTIFGAEQVLRQFDLSYEELLDGIVDGGNDGGIDALYFFINDENITESIDSSRFQRGPVNIELSIIQSKRSRGFAEDPINRLISTCNQLLNLENDLTSSAFTRRFNGELLSKNWRLSDQSIEP